MKNIRQQERKKKMFRREELPEQFMAKKLFGQSDKRYNKEYQRKLERNWRQWKGKQGKRRRT